MTKKGRQFFFRKIGVTASVAAPGDTNPNDATAPESSLSKYAYAMSVVSSGHM